MDKSNYNIDDILSEVKKRREENEKKIKESASENVIPEPTVVEKVEVEETKEPAQTEPEVEEQPIIEEQPAVDDTNEADEESVIEEINDDEELDEDNDEQEMVNLLEFSEKPIDDAEYSEPIPLSETEENNKKGKKKNPAKVIIIILVVLVVCAGVFACFYVNNMLNTITPDENNQVTESEWSGMDTLVENFDPIDETDASQLSSLQDMIKTWYYNGTPCSSTHVLNVLLIGEDTRGEEILEDGTRADSAIIVSINKDTQQITLTSVLRDTYAYWENTEGEESTGQFAKINGAMSVGNVETYITCVENLYKIQIDNYVIVNFDSFESIVDTLGGVTLELTSAEINEINNHPKRYGNVTIEKTFEGTSGEITLTGEQALAYCRIRKLDSDNKRADRQKTCLIQIFNEAQDVSSTKLLKIINTLIPYVKTGFTKNNVVKIAKYALTEGWMNYEVVMNTIPNSRINEKGAGGTYYGAWCWKSDFPQDAYNLQMLIYGKSNITLAKTRVDVLKCREKGFFSEGYSPVLATIENTAYGEVSTLPATTTSSKDEE